MLITDYLKKECIHVFLDGNGKDDLIKKLAEAHFIQFPLIDSKEALSGLFERESLLTTGIGKGIAIPHARLESCREISVSLGLLKTPIDFDSLDREPVKIMFLIFFPKEKVNLQLRFLARVSRLLSNIDLVNNLCSSQTSDEIITIFKEYEAEHFHSD